MIETDRQRRWWFATHPEFGEGRTGARLRSNEKETNRPKNYSPEDVDAYVDERLEHETGVLADLLRSIKRNFGTEAYAEKSDPPSGGHPAADLLLSKNHSSGMPPSPSYPLIRLAQADSETPGSDGTASDAREPTLWEAFLEGSYRTLQYWGIVGARLPPKGTPERAKIERDRDMGIKAKKAEELAEIRAGGKGSGVWSEQELTEIRKTGEFPIDARWHHDPTVANRPDRAADPSAVRPIRGGTKGHLQDGHQGDWRLPKE